MFPLCCIPMVCFFGPLSYSYVLPISVFQPQCCPYYKQCLDIRLEYQGTQGYPLHHLSRDPVLIVSVSEVAWLFFDVPAPSFSQRRLTAGAEREADGPRQDALNLTSLSRFQVLWFNQASPHKLL